MRKLDTKLVYETPLFLGQGTPFGEWKELYIFLIVSKVSLKCFNHKNFFSFNCYIYIYIKLILKYLLVVNIFLNALSIEGITHLSYV